MVFLYASNKQVVTENEKKTNNTICMFLLAIKLPKTKSEILTLISLSLMNILYLNQTNKFC